MFVAFVMLLMYDLFEVVLVMVVFVAVLVRVVMVAGWLVCAGVMFFVTYVDLEVHWWDDGVVLMYFCGLLLREVLVGEVEVFGTFVWWGVSRVDGWYCSVIVVWLGSIVMVLVDLWGARLVVNYL